MNTFFDAVKKAIELKASDIFIVSGQPVTCKVGKDIIEVADSIVVPEVASRFISEAYEFARRDMGKLLACGDDDFAISIPGVTRLRMNAYKQRGSLAAVVRIVSYTIPDYKSIGIPEQVMSLSEKSQGLILVSGVAGSGKSTTLACMINRINHTRGGHIITLEDPIEFLYKNDKCIISQREVGIDTDDYVTALRASLRQSPNVILLGEMRDYETIKTAMTAAETGHLVLSTLHTKGAANTVDRIIDIFPPNQQHQVRIQLAYILQAVVSEQLVPTVDGGITPVFEIMIANTAIKNMIRDSKLHQMDSVIATSAADGMCSMDAGLFELYKKGRIARDTAVDCAMNPDLMEKRIK